MILSDFFCNACELEFENLIDSSSVTLSNCPSCQKPAQKVLSAPRIGLYNDAERRTGALKQRSEAHTKRELAREPERFNLKNKAQPWNLRSVK